MAGSAVNMGLVMASPHIIPPPAGVDVNDIESIKDSIHLYEFKHFIVPFLAHALGTVVGAYVAVIISASYKLIMGLVIGVLFLLGGYLRCIHVAVSHLVCCRRHSGSLHTYGMDRNEINRQSVEVNASRRKVKRIQQAMSGRLNIAPDSFARLVLKY